MSSALRSASDGQRAEPNLNDIRTTIKYLRTKIRSESIASGTVASVLCIHITDREKRDALMKLLNEQKWVPLAIELRNFEKDQTRALIEDAAYDVHSDHLLRNKALLILLLKALRPVVTKIADKKH